MRHDDTLALLAQTAQQHRIGHHCPPASRPEVSHAITSHWYNPGIPGREPCPTLNTLDQIAEDVINLGTAVHVAAHNDDTMRAVASAMLAGTPLADLDPEQADGWVHLARLATEALAHELDRDPVREARAHAALGRLTSVDREAVDRVLKYDATQSGAYGEVVRDTLAHLGLKP